jgi:hypothetical protein
VESFNAAIKSWHSNVGTRGFFRVFGTHKVGFLLAFTIAAVNVELLATFRAGQQRALHRGHITRRATTPPAPRSATSTKTLHPVPPP